MNPDEEIPLPVLYDGQGKSNLISDDAKKNISSNANFTCPEAMKMSKNGTFCYAIAFWLDYKYMEYRYLRHGFISGQLPVNFRCHSSWVQFQFYFESYNRFTKSEAVEYCQHYFPNSTLPYRLDQLIELGKSSLIPVLMRRYGNLGASPWFGVSFDPMKKIMTEDVKGWAFLKYSKSWKNPYTVYYIWYTISDKHHEI